MNVTDNVTVIQRISEGCVVKDFAAMGMIWAGAW